MSFKVEVMGDWMEIIFAKNNHSKIYAKEIFPSIENIELVIEASNLLFE